MKVLVIGDYCLDEFVYCKCDRLSPEAPVPVAEPIWEDQNDGMAGNVYANLKTLAPDHNITRLWMSKSGETTTKTRYIDEESKQTLLRVDRNDKIFEPLEVENIHGNFDAIIIADYNKGTITEKFLIELPKRYPDTDLYLDTKKIIKEWGMNYIIKINKSEYYKSLPSFDEPDEFFYKELIVTEGAKGSSYFGPEVFNVHGKDTNIGSLSVSSHKVEVNEVSGAGDTFMAALVVAKTLEKKPIMEVLDFANKAAAEAVKHVGVVAVKREWIK